MGWIGRGGGGDVSHLAIIQAGIDARPVLIDELGVDSGGRVQRHALVRQQHKALIQGLLEGGPHQRLGGSRERPCPPLRVHPVLHLMPKEGAAHVVAHMHGRVVDVHREQVLPVYHVRGLVVRAELGYLGQRQPRPLLEAVGRTQVVHGQLPGPEPQRGLHETTACSKVEEEG